jgi:Holliday junction resolvase
VKPETKFSNVLVPVLRKAAWFVQRIESGETGNGVPDLYVAKDGFTAWIELKVMDTEWPTANKIPLRPAQWPWLHTHAEHGGVSLLGVKLLNGYVFCRESDVYSTEVSTYRFKKERRSILWLIHLDGGLLDKWLLANE